MPTVKLFVSVSGKKNVKDMHSSFACILYFKEFQESIVNVKKNPQSPQHIAHQRNSGSNSKYQQ